MSNITIKVFPASYGESILVKIGEKEDATNILIDTGFKSTYKYIKKELYELKLKKEKLDLLILTHIDNDHISGAIELLNDYLKNRRFEIGEIWFNDYSKVAKLFKIETGSIVSEDIELIRSLGQLNYIKEHNQNISKKVGYEQSDTLSKLLLNEEIKKIWNKSFFNNAIYVEHSCKLKSVEFKNNIKFTFLGPTKENLNKLLEEWNQFLKDKGFKGNISINEEIIKAFELYFANKKDINPKYYKSQCGNMNNNLEKYAEFEGSDESVINNSSITFILEIEDKKMLFLADTNHLYMCKSLEHFNKVHEVDETFFDAVKVSHHGSRNNTSNELLNTFQSEKYIISTNGYKFKHPDIETVSKLIIKEGDKNIYFNYKPIKIISKLISKKNKKLYDYKLTIKNNTAKGIEVLEIPI